jgi:transcriptional regulator with XRE-family HTH domain
VDKALPNAALGQVIRRLRGERKLTLETLARRSKVSIGTLRGTECRLVDPRWTTIEKIARGLGVGVGALGFEIAKQEEALAAEEADEGRGSGRRGR